MEREIATSVGTKDQAKDDISFVRCGPFESKLEIKTNIVSFGRFEETDDSLHCVPSIFVSRSHAEVYSFNEKWFVMDLGSVNGTFVTRKSETLKIPPYIGFEILSEDIIGFGLSPEVWRSKDEHIKNAEFFVYMFLIERGLEVGELCEEFSAKANMQ